jgi:hypothetical protein
MFLYNKFPKYPYKHHTLSNGKTLVLCFAIHDATNNQIINSSPSEPRATTMMPAQRNAVEHSWDHPHGFDRDIHIIDSESIKLGEQ